MRSRRRSNQSKPLERLAMFKAKPVNRDTLRALGYERRLRQSSTEPSRNPKRYAAGGPKLVESKSSTRRLRATTEAERQANLPRMLRSRLVPTAVTKSVPSSRQATVAKSRTKYASVEKNEHKQGVCQQCGAKKSPYYACRSCGFSLLPSSPKR